MSRLWFNRVSRLNFELWSYFCENPLLAIETVKDKRKMAETSKTDLMDTVKARYVQIIKDYKIGVDVEQVDVVVPPLHGSY